MSSGDFYQGLLGCNVLKGLHAGITVLSPAAIQLPGPRTPRYVQWKQPKSGCLARARILAPPAGANSASTRATPPLPPEQATFDSEGVRLSEEHKKQLRALAEERDAQRAAGDAPDEAWRGLLDRAQRLLREAAIPAAAS